MPPDLVIFGIGINDANKSQANFDPQAYQAQYRALMEYIKRANPDVNFLFITNNDSYYNRKYPNPNALKVREVMRDLATEYNGAVWDLFEVMGGLNSCVTWEKAGLAKSDRIHFTPDGYRLQGDLMFDGLRTAFGNYLNHKYSTKLEP
jgi:lysophospholipase L1-like esterase